MIPMDAAYRENLCSFGLLAPTKRLPGSRPRNFGVMKKLTMSQEGSRPHGAAGLLDDQRPQLNEERGAHLGPP